MSRLFRHATALWRKRSLLFSSTGVILLIVLGWFFFARGSAAPEVLVAQRSDFVDSVSVSGKVVPAHAVDLGFAQSGRISGTYIKVGQRVSAGTLLAQVENGDLRAAVLQKKASLATAQADLASLDAGTRPEEVAVSEAQVIQDEAALRDALEDAYIAADNAVRNKIDQFLLNPRIDPQFTFDVSDSSVANAVKIARLSAESLLTTWQNSLSTSQNLTTATTEARSAMSSLQGLLNDSNAALNRALPSASVTQSKISGYITDMGTARTALNNALASLNAAATKLDTDTKSLLLAQAPATMAERSAALSRVASAQAEVENAQAALAKTLVVAPLSGTITRMDAKVGTIVSPGDSQISMMSNGAFEIETFVPELGIAKLAAGDMAVATLDAYGGEEFEAKVIAIDPAETLQGGVPSYKTTLQFTKADPRVRSGLSADITIVTEHKPNTLVIPKAALIKRGTTTYVLLLLGKERREVPVTLGIESTGAVEITSGLREGDVVVINP